MLADTLEIMATSIVRKSDWLTPGISDTMPPYFCRANCLYILVIH